jgi:periplasmic copper chaperone A
MNMERFSFLLPLALVAASSCGQPQQELYVDKAAVNLPAVPGRPAAAYFTVHGGPQPDRLLEVFSPVAIRAELHDNVMTGAMTSMKPIENGVEIPAGGKVDFKAGGKHVMLFDVSPHLIPGKSFPMVLTFSSGLKIEIEAAINTAGTKPAHEGAH